MGFVWAPMQARPDRGEGFSSMVREGKGAVYMKYVGTVEKTLTQ